MNLVNRFRELSDEQQRYVKIAGVVLLGIALIIFFFGYNRQTISDTAIGPTETTLLPGATTSTIPGTVEDDPPLPSGDYEGVPDVTTTVPFDTSTINEEDDPAQGYAEKVITAAQAETVWPAASSGLNDAERTQLNALARNLVTARMTGVGRDQFPDIFTTTTDPDELFIKNFGIEFSTAMTSTFTQNKRPLYRTIVGWNGTDPADVQFAQVRIANYFVKDGDRFLAVPTGNLPVALQRTDGLLSGVTIYG